MRDAIRIQLTPGEYQDHMRAERARLVEELARDFEHARESGAEWYRWVLDGCPRLTEAEYARVGKYAKAGTDTSDRSTRGRDEQLQVGS